MRFLLHYSHQLVPAVRRRNRGFTLVELMVVSPMVILLIGVMIAAIISLTGEVLVARTKNHLIYSQQDTLERIQTDVEVSTNFLPESDIAPASPQGFNNISENFTNVGTNGNMLILKTLLTDKSTIASDRQLIRLNTPLACNDANADTNSPMYGVVVYFVKNNSLWRRTILPANYATAGCAGGTQATPWQQPSCYPGISGGACKTNDIELLKGVTASTFTTMYFAQANSTSENTTATSTTASLTERRDALNATNTVEIALSATQLIAGKDVSYATTARLTKSNSPAP